MTSLSDEQAKMVGRIRDALHALGFATPTGEPKSPGSLADLAHMAPIMGQFTARMGASFVAAVRAETDPLRRAKLFVRYAEAAVIKHRQPGKVPLSVVLEALGKGFVAFHTAKSPAGQMSAVLHTLSNINAAPSR